MDPITLPRLEAQTGFEPAVSAASRPGDGAFAEALRAAAGPYARAAEEATRQIDALVAGEASDLHTVQIAVAKADVAFEMLLQVRNKLIHAYQEILQMQV